MNALKSKTNNIYQDKKVSKRDSALRISETGSALRGFAKKYQIQGIKDYDAKLLMNEASLLLQKQGMVIVKQRSK